VHTFGADATQLAMLYMRRHRLFKMHKSMFGQDLEADDYYAFFVIDEEVSRWQADKQRELERETDRIRSQSPH